MSYIYYKAPNSDVGECVRINNDPYNSDRNWIPELIASGWTQTDEATWNLYFTKRVQEEKKKAELEAAKFVKATLYLHSDKSDMYNVMIGQGISDDLSFKARYALSEVEFNVEIDKETGIDRITKVRYGKQTLVPE